ncbi:MAG TPA: phosphoribosylglycinamide formyltransferase [Chloroflexota bacterium]|nr:phosphoribosylglycinamide formyltransferase [Chloroflexota bacterium]
MMPSITTLDRPSLPLAPTACIRLGVLASGRGTNLQALLDAASARRIPAEIVAVASNRHGALALDRARRAGVPASVFQRTEFPARAAQEQAVVDFLRQHGVELVVLAGYVPVLGATLLDSFHHRVVNIHPSLLPAFGKTLHAQADALRHGVKITGCTVHFVTSQVDGGPIILQRAVPVLEGDTEESLSARILEQEHQALPEAIGLIAAGRVVIDGDRTRILPAE